jgi:pyrroline-5-carboxylate reductase
MRVLVLGAGKMVEAILLGLKKEMSLKDWAIYSPSGKSAQKLALATGATWIKDPSDFKGDVILVGFKPQQLKDASAQIKDKFSNALFISILAGIDESTQRNFLGARQLIRVMPNLSVAEQKGISLLSSHSVGDKILEIKKLFSQIGFCQIVTEDELDELTLLTGSGPAFIYEFASALIDSFHSLDSQSREFLVRKMILGAAATMENSPYSLRELTSAVTSKGGVTEATLKSWVQGDFGGLIKKGIREGVSRSKQLRDSIHN